MVSATFDNSSDLGWVVQKFGGTSVGKFPDKVSVDFFFSHWIKMERGFCCLRRR